jgi:hypothetical protein
VYESIGSGGIASIACGPLLETIMVWLSSLKMIRTTGSTIMFQPRRCAMRRCNLCHAKANRRLRGGAAAYILGCVTAAAFLFAVPGFVPAAGWLAPGADQTVEAPWVKDVEAQLNENPYRDVFANAPGEPPHPAVVRYLNNAAKALEAGNKPLARSYIDRTLDIFDNGVLRGYYSRSDVEPIKKMIRARAEAAIKGEQAATATQDDDRWTGYTQRKPLGLVNESSDSLRMTSEHPAAEK